MCFRNSVAYSCPGLHVLLNPDEPFTLCKLAQHHPIQRQCGNIVDKCEVSDGWCIHCWMREHASKTKKGDDGKRVWNDNWRGGTEWSGYGGDNGKDIWRDDVPQ